MGGDERDEPDGPGAAATAEAAGGAGGSQENMDAATTTTIPKLTHCIARQSGRRRFSPQARTTEYREGVLAFAMLERELREYLTFDDVMLLPAYSQVLPGEVAIRSKLTRHIP